MFVSARKLLDMALVACIAYPTAQCAFGQTNRPAAPPTGQAAPNGPVGTNRTFAPDAGRDQNHILQGSALLGSTVMLQGGGNYGTVRDFVISDSGCLEYAVLSADNGLVAIPWSAGTFDSGRRAFMLGFGRDRVRDLPRIRDIAELRDARVQQRVQTFFRGDHMQGKGDQRATDNAQRGAENHTQTGTTRGAAPRPAPQNNERGTNREGNERRER
jgi:hypothetical protein